MSQAETKFGKSQTKQAGEGHQATGTEVKPDAAQQQANDQSKAKVQTEQQTGGQAKPDTSATASITNVTVDQRTEITNVIREERVEPVPAIDFSVSVGVAVPHHVHLHRLPARIVKIIPAYRHYEYFVLADGRIVIVDPNDLKIVVILTA